MILVEVISDAPVPTTPVPTVRFPWLQVLSLIVMRDCPVLGEGLASRMMDDPVSCNPLLEFMWRFSGEEM